MEILLFHELFLDTSNLVDMAVCAGCISAYTGSIFCILKLKLHVQIDLLYHQISHNFPYQKIIFRDIFSKDILTAILAPNVLLVKFNIAPFESIILNNKRLFCIYCMVPSLATVLCPYTTIFRASDHKFGHNRRISWCFCSKNNSMNPLFIWSKYKFVVG